MTIYHVDSAGDDSDGLTWAKAYNSLQSLLASETLSNINRDVVYCRGTYTATSSSDYAILHDVGSGYYGSLEYTGCKGSANTGVCVPANEVDGTQYTIDADSTADHCIELSNVDFTHIRNFTFKNATSHGLDFTTSYTKPFILQNCVIKDNGGYGAGGDGTIYNYGMVLIKCSVHNNSSGGVIGGTAANTVSAIFSSFTDNGGHGIKDFTGLSYACIYHGNTDDGVDGRGILTPNVINNVFSSNGGNGYTFSTDSYPGIIVGNRFTSNTSYGVEAGDARNSVCVVGLNYFEDNGTNLNAPTPGTPHFIIFDDDEQTSTNLEDEADTNEGYVSLTAGAEDFDIAEGATLRSKAVTIPIDY